MHSNSNDKYLWITGIIVISYITSIEKLFDYSTGYVCLDEMCADYKNNKFIFFFSSWTVFISYLNWKKCVYCLCWTLYILNHFQIQNTLHKSILLPKAAIMWSKIKTVILWKFLAIFKSYFIYEYILKCNLFLWSKMYFQHHYSSLQCHMILQISLSYADVLLKKHFWLLWMLKTVVLLHIYLETMIHFKFILNRNLGPTLYQVSLTTMYWQWN